MHNANSNDTFTNFTNMNLDEIKTLIHSKFNLLKDKIDGNVDKQESENSGYLFWNCKTILKNIYMAYDKIISKYKDSISSDEYNEFVKKSTIIKNDESSWENLDSIKATYMKLIDDDIVEEFKKNTSVSDIQTAINKIDSKISELKESEIQDNYEHNYIIQLEEKLKMNKQDILKNFKRLESEKATYYWNPIRGGISLIVSDDGSYLGATSSVNFDRHLEEFKKGKRNGKFN